ncbi:MAG: ECF transporter S component [Clostridia bacterium]|nr:ECF transporter S component [Clostridia bacterium]
MIPVLLGFEASKPKSRELVIISVLCAVTVAGRSAFYMLPQFKPVAALVILSAVCFGAEKGFLVGAVSAFVSNIFFGQGPWTPWQMLCFGAVGYVAGLIFAKGIVRPSRITLTVYGGVAIMVLYGGIMNPASVIMYQPEPTWEMIVSSYVMGIPYDAIHAVSTMFFLWFASEPMIEKLERVKIKYGIIK